MNIDELKTKKLKLFAEADKAFVSNDRTNLARLEREMNKIDEQIDELQSK